MMGEKEEKKEKGVTVQEDKDDKNNEPVPWGKGDPNGSCTINRFWNNTFSVEIDKVKPLEELGYYDTRAVTQFGGLCEEFKDHKLPLSNEAYVLTLASGSLWSIIDGDKEYEIRRNKELKKLKIYSEKVPLWASFKKT